MKTPKKEPEIIRIRRLGEQPKQEQPPEPPPPKKPLTFSLGDLLKGVALR